MLNSIYLFYAIFTYDYFNNLCCLYLLKYGLLYDLAIIVYTFFFKLEHSLIISHISKRFDKITNMYLYENKDGE